MQFIYTWEAVLAGTKTQTQRLTKLDDVGIQAEDGRYTAVRRSGRTHYTIGKEYAIQPGRRAKQIGRIHLLQIERQPVQAITREQAIAEGVMPADSPPDADHRSIFAAQWNEIHTQPATRWDDNPDVWVLTFELAQPKTQE
jgi:hypothetical protein